MTHCIEQAAACHVHEMPVHERLQDMENLADELDPVSFRSLEYVWAANFGSVSAG